MDSALESKTSTTPHDCLSPYLSLQEEKACIKLAPGEASLAASETMHRPEDSVYYHPTLNPLGLPPPGKAQR